MQLVFVLAEERPDQALKRLRQRGVRNITFVLVEFSRCEKPARGYERLVQLIDQGGLADTGIAADEHQLRPAARNDSIERGEQRIDLMVAPVQPLRNHEVIWSVMI